ncbi:MAG: hypothetical protein PHV59_12295 [Victivallales bacterium]|nr:hypothetical protein [Victivallales bacterium]
MIVKFLAYVQGLWHSAADFASLPFYADIEPGWHFILRAFLIAVFCFGSAFLAATIAESRRHKLKFHFLLGLILPWIYPVVQFFILKPKSEPTAADEEVEAAKVLSDAMTDRLRNITASSEAKHAERIKGLQRKKTGGEAEPVPESSADTEAVPEPESIRLEPEPAKVEPEPEKTEDVPEKTGAGKGIFTQRYFQAVAVDSSGAKVGPFKVVVSNGNEFTVSCIKNIQSDLASFEIDARGKSKSIRIRYENIVSFEKL